MNKMKKIAVIAVAVTLSTGALFAQPRQGPGSSSAQPPRNSESPAHQERNEPAPNLNQAPAPFSGKLLGIVDEITNNTLTFIDMDGKRITVTVTPFTDIQDIEKLDRVDPTAKNSREQLKLTYLSLNQLHKGNWVDINAFRTEGGKLVAEYIRVIRMPYDGEK